MRDRGRKRTHSRLLCGITDPCPVQVDGDEGGRDCEVVDERVVVQHEPELVARGEELKWPHPSYLHCGACRDKKLNANRTTNAYPYEKVDHEENVESEIDLLGQVFAPRNAFFHAFAALDKGVVNH